MKNIFRVKKYLWILILSLIVIGSIAIFYSQHGKKTSYRDKYEGVDLSVNIEGMGRTDTYTMYLKQFEKTYPQNSIMINVTDTLEAKGTEVVEEYYDQKDVLLTQDDSFVSWEINVKDTGFYHVLVEYYPMPGNGTDIERKLLINDQVPFVGADKLLFTRLWGDGGEVRVDNQGNEIRPSQVEIPDWNFTYCKDSMGYEVKPYEFYLEKGKNTIALESVKEPMAIKSITLHAIAETIDYDSYLTKIEEKVGNVTAVDFKKVFQGEASSIRTSPSLYASYDRSSPATEPYSVSQIKLNMGGGYAYRIAGQWIEWNFEVPEDGYYYIDLKSRQNYQRGFVSNRAVYIDGEIPFEELGEVPFHYSNEWEQITLGTTKEDSKLYLEAGVHAIRLEVTMGDLGEILSELENSVFRLNEIYRKILVLTGNNPDRYRDYQIEVVYPEVIESMELESKRLYKIVDDVVAYSGQKASQIAIAQTVALQLERFVEKPYDIPASLVNFNTNVSALGTAILAMSESPLDIDSITIRGTEVEKDDVHVYFWQSAWHEIRSFVASFFEDYNTVGNVYEGEDIVEVWILAGRDQTNVLKNMTEDDFTPNSGIKVNVKLVEAASLLNAIIAGTGPDVVLSIAQTEPVNYALRNAVEDLTQFEDYNEVLDRFHESAYEPFEFDEGLYALPETQTYDIMFYRTDIMGELGLEIPNTWEELINILPIIQQNNMGVAIPSLMSVFTVPDPSTFISLLYQNGGDIYSEDGTKSLLDSQSGVAAFETYTKFFTHYDLMQDYNFINRFRSGEMPLGIQNYGMYNTLAVFAPEIRGLWDFALIPGTEQADGSIDRSVYGTSTGSMILKQENETVRSYCWDFLKWWTDADTQVRFGREMESVLGASARYATANIEAFTQLPWTKNQQSILMEQWEDVNGTEQAPGGYYMNRHITNAVRNVVNNDVDPRETLVDYTRTINEEIEKKRIEFNLEVE